MADYNTKAVTIGGVTVTVSKKADGGGSAGDRLTALLEWLATRGKPDNTLPGGGTVDNTLPGTPDNSLPGAQPGIDNSLPGAQPGIDNSLPRDWLHDHAGEIAKAVLGHCFDCKPAQPK